MRFYQILAILLLCGCAFASFSYVASFNGNSTDDADTTFVFSNPTGLVFGDGKLYVADTGKNALYIFNGTVRQKMVYSNSNTLLASPLRMAYDNGVLYIADSGSGKIKTYSGFGSDILEWNSGTNMGRPSGVAIGQDQLYITDSEKGRVYLYSRATKSYSSIGIESGGSDGFLASPTAIEYFGGQFFVSDAGKDAVFVYDQNLTYQYAIGRGKGGVSLKSPRGLKVYDNRLYVADTNNNRVVSFTLEGYPTEILDSSVEEGNLSYPADLAISNGQLYVADSFNRIIKVFNISQAAGNDTVLQAIRSANASAQDLYRLQDSSRKLNLTLENVSFDSDLRQAMADYSNFQFTTASSTAQRVGMAVDSAKQAIYQSMDVRIKQLLKEAADKVAPCRAAAGSDSVLAASLADFDSKVADTNAKSAARNYGPAADLALSLPGIADGISSRAASLESQQAAIEKNRTLNFLRIRLNDLSSRLQTLQAKSDAYRQAISLSNARRLVSSSNDSIASGEFETANATLDLAATDIGSYEKSIAQKSLDIDAALSNLSIIEFGLNSSASKTLLIPANLEAERASLAAARETVYSNPQLALVMAMQASDSADAKVKESQTVSVAAAALLVMVGMIGLLSVAFFIHLRSRRKRGMGNAEGGHEKRK